MHFWKRDIGSFAKITSLFLPSEETEQRIQAPYPQGTGATVGHTQGSSPRSVSSAELGSFWSLTQWYLKVDAGSPCPSNKRQLAELKEFISASSSGPQGLYKRTSQNPALTARPASDTSTSPARQRRSRRREAILSTVRGPVRWPPPAWAFYAPFSQATPLIPANWFQTCWFWLLT